MGNKEKVLMACDMIKKIQNEMVGTYNTIVFLLKLNLLK